MPPWSIPAVSASVLIALHYLTLRAASGRIGDALGAFLLEATAALGIVALMLLRLAPPAPTTTAGIVWSCASGLCISGATTLMFVTLRLGGPVAATGTIVLGGGVAIAAMIAPLFFAEAFSPRRAIGVLLGLASVAILATEKR
jgi:multidrug transporter EmrE-like cation transporter